MTGKTCFLKWHCLIEGILSVLTLPAYTDQAETMVSQIIWRYDMKGFIDHNQHPEFHLEA